MLGSKKLLITGDWGLRPTRVSSRQGPEATQGTNDVTSGQLEQAKLGHQGLHQPAGARGDSVTSNMIMSTSR